MPSSDSRLALLPGHTMEDAVGATKVSVTGTTADGSPGTMVVRPKFSATMPVTSTKEPSAG